MADIKEYATVDFPATLGIVEEMNPTVMIFYTLNRSLDKLMCKKCRESGKSAICVDDKAKLRCLYYKEAAK